MPRHILDFYPTLLDVDGKTVRGDTKAYIRLKLNTSRKTKTNRQSLIDLASQRDTIYPTLLSDQLRPKESSYLKSYINALEVFIKKSLQIRLPL